MARIVSRTEAAAFYTQQLRGSILLIAAYQFTPSATRKAEFVRTLRIVTASARGKPGCVGSYIYQDIVEPYTLLLFEYWENRRLMDQHLRSDQFRKVLALMEMSYRRPLVQFLEASDLGGLDLIQEVLRPEA